MVYSGYYEFGYNDLSDLFPCTDMPSTHYIYYELWLYQNFQCPGVFGISVYS